MRHKSSIDPIIKLIFDKLKIPGLESIVEDDGIGVLCDNLNLFVYTDDNKLIIEGGDTDMDWGGEKDFSTIHAEFDLVDSSMTTKNIQIV